MTSEFLCTRDQWHLARAEAVACDQAWTQLVQALGIPDTACIPGDADAPTPVYASDAQVQAVLRILIAEGALPRGVASFGKPLEDFARRLVEAVVGKR